MAAEYQPGHGSSVGRCKILARNLQIAQRALLPSLVAVAATATSRKYILSRVSFSRQMASHFDLYWAMNYTNLDFGARGGRIAEARVSSLVKHADEHNHNAGIDDDRGTILTIARPLPDFDGSSQRVA